jgi:hypothetical protein
MSTTRQRVLALYKELHRLGRDYPDPKYHHLSIFCKFHLLQKLTPCVTGLPPQL